MEQKSIKVNAVLNIIYAVTNMIFPLITFPYVSRILLVALIGKVTFFTNVSSYATMIAALGLSTYGIRAVARVRDDEEELSKTTQELFVINFIATVVVILSLLVSCLFISKFSEDVLLLLVNCLLILSAPLGLNWLYSGLEQYSYITKRALVFKTISLVSIFVFVHSEDDYIKYALIVVLSSVGSYLCNFIYAQKIISFKRRHLDFKKHIKPMLTLFASILAINVYTHLDMIMLGFINGDRDVGLYTIAVYVKTALLTMVNAISVVLLPRVSYYISEGKNVKLKQLLTKTVKVIMLIALPLTIFFIIEAQDTIFILGGSQYMDAILCMEILMPVLLISGFSNITGNQVLIPLGLDKFYLRAVIAGAIVDLILNFLFMPSFGCVGAAMATLLAEIIQMSIQFNYAKGYILECIKIKEHLKILVSAAIAAIFLILLKYFITGIPLIQIIVFAAFFFSLYGIVLIILREEELIQILKLAHVCRER